MEKSIFGSEYTVFTAVLRGFRKRSGLTQVQLAEKVGQTQSYISKYERGELRLDLVQLRQFCLALGIGLVDFVNEFEAQLPERKSRRTRG